MIGDHMPLAEARVLNRNSPHIRHSGARHTPDSDPGPESGADGFWTPAFVGVTYWHELGITELR
jgi:hypothetical protein